MRWWPLNAILGIKLLHWCSKCKFNCQTIHITKCICFKTVYVFINMKCIKSVIYFTAGSEFQVYNIATRERLAQCDMFDTVVFWTWASSEVIAIVTQDAVFHWCLHKSRFSYINEIIKIYWRNSLWKCAEWMGMKGVSIKIYQNMFVFVSCLSVFLSVFISILRQLQSLIESMHASETLLMLLC